MFTKQELDNLCCEVIETFDKYGFEGEYRIMLKDKYYDGGWINESIDLKRWDCKFWNEEFNLSIDGFTNVMFNEDPRTIHEWYDDCDKICGENMIECYRKLRRIFRRYGLKWRTLDFGLKVTFRKIYEKAS